MLVLLERYLASRKITQAKQKEAVPPGEHKRTNVFEWGILRVLYLICLKCRDPRCRRRAVRLLSGAQRQEATLKSGALAIYEQAVICLEEERAGGLSSEAMVCMRRVHA